jgi:hypothetical protein
MSTIKLIIEIILLVIVLPMVICIDAKNVVKDENDYTGI